MSVTPPQMPFRREPSAPSFDPTQPRSLLRYFEDLEQLFAQCGIQDLVERKKWTLHYVPIEVADLWEYLPGWISATDWPALKSSVAARYPARYHFADLVTLVDDQRSQEIRSLDQWNTFLNQFLIISQYLLAQHHLDPLEQQRYLLQSLSPSLCYEVESYMCRINPRRDAEHLASVAEIDTAVQYCLRASPHLALATGTIVQAEPSNSSETVAQLAALIAELVDNELTKLEYQS